MIEKYIEKSRNEKGMTTASVTKVDLLSGSAQRNQGKPVSSVDDFSGFLKNQKVKTEEDSGVNTPSRKDGVSQRVDQPKKSKDWDSGKPEKISCKESVNVDQLEESEELSEEEMEEVLATIAEMVHAISKELQVSVTEIQNACDTLQLQPEDVCNPDALAKLVVSLTDGADELSLMTNEAVFQQLKNLKEIQANLLQHLSEKMDVPVEELQNLLAKATEKQEAGNAEIVGEVNGLEEKDTSFDHQLIRMNGLNEAELSGKEAVSLEKKQDSFQKDSQKEESSRDKNNSLTDGNENAVSASQKVFDEVKAAVAKLEGSHANVVLRDSILDQIQNGIKVIQKENLTEMELQLHPASLGKVKVQLASREGLVTASFTAENEAVRAALESQMAVLRQNFEQQGIKVEAVEVTVASHAFEENLNDAKEDGSYNEREEKRAHRRKLSLNEIMNADMMDELPEEERVVADLMRRNGNSVDYLA